MGDSTSMKLNPPSVFIFVGHSGSGKTTLVEKLLHEPTRRGLCPVSYTHLDVYKRQVLIDCTELLIRIRRLVSKHCYNHSRSDVSNLECRGKTGFST